MAQLKRRFITVVARTTKRKRHGFARLWNAFGRACAYCMKAVSFKDATRDHLRAVGRGGADGITNVVPACWDCNHDKANMSVASWLALRGRDEKAVLDRIERIRRPVLDDMGLR